MASVTVMGILSVVPATASCYLPSRSSSSTARTPRSTPPSLSFDRANLMKPLHQHGQDGGGIVRAGGQLHYLVTYAAIYVPPHPLIKHFLSILRNEITPSALFNMDTSKFLKLVKEKTKKALEEKEAPLRWQQELEAGVAAYEAKFKAAWAERKVARKRRRHKRSSCVFASIDDDSHFDRARKLKRRHKRHRRKHSKRRRKVAPSDSSCSSEDSSTKESLEKKPSKRRARKHRRRDCSSLEVDTSSDSEDCKERHRKKRQGSGDEGWDYDKHKDGSKKKRRNQEDGHSDSEARPFECNQH